MAILSLRNVQSIGAIARKMSRVGPGGGCLVDHLLKIFQNETATCEILGLTGAQFSRSRDGGKSRRGYSGISRLIIHPRPRDYLGLHVLGSRMTGR